MTDATTASSSTCPHPPRVHVHAIEGALCRCSRLCACGWTTSDMNTRSESRERAKLFSWSYLQSLTDMLGFQGQYHN